MSLSIHHINADATFLIALHLPRHPSGNPTDVTTEDGDFSILVDPWLHSDAPVIHPRFSNQTHTIAPAISTLAELSPAPDLIMVSQSKSDHCHEGTLREFEWTKHPSTRLYACPDACSIIKSWGWFPSERIVAFKKGTRVRVDIPDSGNTAWVELEYIPARWPWEMPSLHSAIGVKYYFTEGRRPKVISMLFTPHGVPMSALRPWLSRLEGGSPRLAVLLHPFTRIYSVLGGQISGGFPAGLEICKAVEVGTWVSAHDEAKLVEGFVASRLDRTMWGCEKAGADLLAAGVGNVVVKELGVDETLKIGEGTVVRL